MYITELGMNLAVEFLFELNSIVPFESVSN